MRKRYKIFLSIIITLVILLLSFVVYMKYFRNAETKEANKSNIVHNIENYGHLKYNHNSQYYALYYFY